MIGVLVAQGVFFSFNEQIAGFLDPATVLRIGYWSKVVREGIRRME